VGLYSNGTQLPVASGEAGVEVTVRSKMSLEARPSGGETPYKYQWRFNGTNIPGATRARFDVPSVLTTHLGRYDVVISTPSDRVTAQE